MSEVEFKGNGENEKQPDIQPASGMVLAGYLYSETREQNAEKFQDVGFGPERKVKMFKAVGKRSGVRGRLPMLKPSASLRRCPPGTGATEQVS